MILNDFIKMKEEELSKDYRKVEFKFVEDVVLSTNSVSRNFSSEKSKQLTVEGREAKLSELGETSSIPFVPNGSLVVFEYVPPRKRKPIKKDYYFLWEN